MQARHVVVDGSNIATEGSSLPTLKQLDEAVREFLIENPDDVVTVVVDATFGHRIPPEERQLFEEAESGARSSARRRGRSAGATLFCSGSPTRSGAVVLSNDSFQEFHGEYEWLFDKGRLIGGKPVPGVGWIFTPRTPVRGPKSRESVKEAKRKKRAEVEEPTRAASTWPPNGLAWPWRRAQAATGYSRRRRRGRRTGKERAQTQAPEAGRRGAGGAAQRAVQLYYLYRRQPTGRRGGRDRGGVLLARGVHFRRWRARCYLPLSGMGDVASAFGARGAAQRREADFRGPGFRRHEARDRAGPAGLCAPCRSTHARDHRRRDPSWRSGQEASGGEPPLEIAVEKGRATAGRRPRRTAAAGASASKQAERPSLAPEPMATDKAQPRGPATRRGALKQRQWRPLRRPGRQKHHPT